MCGCKVGSWEIMQYVTSWKCSGWVVGCGIGCGYVFELFWLCVSVITGSVSFSSLPTRVSFCFLHSFSERITHSVLSQSTANFDSLSAEREWGRIYIPSFHCTVSWNTDVRCMRIHKALEGHDDFFAGTGSVGDVGELAVQNNWGDLNNLMSPGHHVRVAGGEIKGKRGDWRQTVRPTGNSCFR